MALTGCFCMFEPRVLMLSCGSKSAVPLTLKSAAFTHSCWGILKAWCLGVLLMWLLTRDRRACRSCKYLQFKGQFNSL
jgi:hypothetical protein